MTTGLLPPTHWLKQAVLGQSQSMTRVVSQRQLHTSVCCGPSSQSPSFSLAHTHTHTHTHSARGCVCAHSRQNEWCTVGVCVLWISCQAGGGGRLPASRRNPIRQDEPFSAIEPGGSAMADAKSQRSRQLLAQGPRLLPFPTCPPPFCP